MNYELFDACGFKIMSDKKNLNYYFLKISIFDCYIT